AAGTSRDEYTTAYRYFSQPYSLKLQVGKRERRVDATAQYDMTIGEEEVLLDMTVDYQITGVSARELPIGFPMRFELGGWALRSPSGQVATPIASKYLENATPEV